MNTLPNRSTFAAASLPPGPISMERLNSECFCISLDASALRQALESEIGEPGLFDLIQQRCPYLFATRPVFLSHPHRVRMARLVQAIESVVALPAYRDEVLATAPAIARHDPGGAKGVFFGYGFHVAESSFGLIEINTNAGGAMLNAVLARAQRACCAAVQNEEPEQVLKFDLRDYTYDGRVRWVAARVYQGQTTNFRTPGGGFAPVFYGPADGSGGLLSKSCVTAQHESRLFLLDGNEVQPLAHDRYVALARGEAAADEFADRRFILVDWYLRLACGRPKAIVNETCSWLVFDAQGLLDLHAAHAIDAVAAPTERQWAQVRVLVIVDASVVHVR